MEYLFGIGERMVGLLLHLIGDEVVAVVLVGRGHVVAVGGSGLHQPRTLARREGDDDGPRATICQPRPAGSTSNPSWWLGADGLASRGSAREECEFFTIDLDVELGTFADGVVLARSLKGMLDGLGLGGKEKQTVSRSGRSQREP